MLFLRKSNLLTKLLERQYVTQVKPLVIPDEKTLNEIDNGEYKFRNHPGILKPRMINVPDGLIKAISNVTEEFSPRKLYEKSIDLVRHLKGKNPPMEGDDLKQLSQKIHQKVANKLAHNKITNESEEIKYKQSFKDKYNNLMRKKLYNWQPVVYDEHSALVYLIGRLAPEYAVISKIFSEIKQRKPNFKPRSLFDFGSGVGSVTWAANAFWKKDIFEYFHVDSSVHMNDLAQILLQGGRGNKKMPLKGVFYRQFLPASNTSYDLVVSAYSLLELPSRQARLETVLKLWNKTENYFVVVEQGTNAGFKVVNEVRDFILHTENKRNKGHLFSPCPHDDVCPRFLLNDDTPCNFEIKYMSLPFGAPSQPLAERYSYVVIKKGERSEEDSQWPRVIRSPLIRSKHTICRMCTKNGKIEEVIFTASKHGKTMYHCGRSTKWGDLLPIKIAENAQDSEPSSKDCDENLEKI